MNIVATAHSARRNRPFYVLLAALVLGGGLLWRSRFLQLPPFASKYGGDLLWALLVFCGLAFTLHRASTLRLALIALGFAWAIEFSQMYHAEWIDRIRSMRIGALILGSTFNWPDLLAYAIGISVGALFDRFHCNAQTNGKQIQLTAAAEHGRPARDLRRPTGP